MFRVDVRDDFDASPFASADRAAEAALREGLRRVAERARSDHVFTNRTGTLEGSITEGVISGTFSGGTLEGEVDATADYAEHVIAATNDDFVQRAADAEEDRIGDEIADAFLDALNGV